MATEFDKLVVRLVGDNTSLKKMLNETQAEVKKATREIDQATKSVNGLQGPLDKMGKNLLNFGKSFGLAGLAIGSGLAFLLKSAVSEFNALDKTNAMLIAGMKSNGANVDKLMPKYEAFAKNIQDITTISDSATRNLLQQAEATGLSGTAAIRASRNAIALASAKDMDVKSAIKLTTALEFGDTQMLQRHIPAVKKAKTEAEKLGAAHLALSQMFNSSTEEAKTFGGTIKKVWNEFGELKENIGKAAGVAFMPLAKALLELLNTINKYPKAITAFAAALLIGAQLLVVIVLLKTLTKILWGVKIAQVAAFGGGTKALTTQVGLISKIIELYKKLTIALVAYETKRTAAAAAFTPAKAASAASTLYGPSMLQQLSNAATGNIATKTSMTVQATAATKAYAQTLARQSDIIAGQSAVYDKLGKIIGFNIFKTREFTIETKGLVGGFKKLIPTIGGVGASLKAMFFGAAAGVKALVAGIIKLVIAAAPFAAIAAVVALLVAGVAALVYGVYKLTSHILGTKSPWTEFWTEPAEAAERMRKSIKDARGRTGQVSAKAATIESADDRSKMYADEIKLQKVLIDQAEKQKQDLEKQLYGWTVAKGKSEKYYETFGKEGTKHGGMGLLGYFSKENEQLKLMPEKIDVLKQALAELEEEKKRLGDFPSLKVFEEELKKTNKELKEQAENFGRSQQEIELWRLQQTGAPERVLAPVRESIFANQALRNEIEAKTKAADATKKLSEDTKDYIKELKEEAMEIKYGAEAMKLKDLIARGLTTQQAALISRMEKANEAAKKEKELAEDIKNLNKDLMNQIDTFGLAGTTLQTYQLRLRGATDAEIKFSRALGGKLTALQKNQELMQKGKELTLKHRSPTDQLADSYRELLSLYKSGAIDRNTFNKELKEANKIAYEANKIATASTIDATLANSADAAAKIQLQRDKIEAGRKAEEMKREAAKRAVNDPKSTENKIDIKIEKHLGRMVEMMQEWIDRDPVELNGANL